MQAVIVTGGKQYSVKEGDVIYVEKLNAEADATVTFDQVLAVVDGENSKFGAPVVAGASVEAKVLKNGKAKKVVVFKTAVHQGADRKDVRVMTKVEIFNHDGRIHGFSVSGHSGYAEEGSDIVCAAVSAAVTFAECTINDVLGNHANTKVKEEEPRITLTLPAACDDEDAVQAVLTGFLLTVCSLRDNYPEYIEVMEV